jgi:hypothetical protein
MGVTIYFEGKLKTDKDFETIIKIATNFSIKNDLECLQFEESNKLLQRVKNEKDWDYRGLTKGIKIQPDSNSDPLWLEFDKDYYIQEYCKTQFSETYIHIKIVELLKEIEPYFERFIVTDEGEFWDTQNIDILNERFNECFTAIEKAKKENSNLSGPYKIKGERIVDLMEN